MNIYIRPSTINDSDFYMKCFTNKEFVEMLCYHEEWNIDDYLKNEKDDIHVICSTEIGNRTQDICFAHFINNGGNCFTIIGGVLPNYFNSGIGVLCGAAAIFYFFESHRNHTLIGGVFFHNERSLRMQMALGFKKIREQKGRHILQLTENDFRYNSFTNRILRDINIIKYDRLSKYIR